MEEKNIYDMLFDEENNDNITLYGDDNEPIEFEQVAVVPYDGSIYAILHPVVLIDGMEENEALVFEVTGEDNLELVIDDDIIDAVFDIYYEMVEAEGDGQ